MEMYIEFKGLSTSQRNKRLCNKCYSISQCKYNTSIQWS